jgi:hypothetical protein
VHQNLDFEMWVLSEGQPHSYRRSTALRVPASRLPRTADCTIYADRVIPALRASLSIASI